MPAGLQVRHIVVMGVSGTGKTTVGRRLASEIGATFIEGDSFHPEANIQKMSAGHPLTDDDRRPWLDAVAGEIERSADRGESTVTACSSLKRMYRDWLRRGNPDVFFVHLVAEYEVLLDRMARRKHFMPPSLLQSQFETLEDLQPDERGARVPDRGGIDVVVASAVQAVVGR